MKRVVPWRWRFQINADYRKGSFFLRIVLGFILIYAARRWEYPASFGLETTLKIGWIPWKIEVGNIIPCWTVFRFTNPDPRYPWWMKP